MSGGCCSPFGSGAAPVAGCVSNGVIITGSFACAENNLTTASGSFSFAQGDQTVAFGQASHAEGTSTLANGVSAHVEGHLSRADGTNAHAEGSQGFAQADNSHVEGQSTSTSSGGTNGHAEGFNTSVSADSGHAEGRGTGATGLAAHAEGASTLASATAAHSEGFQTVASGGPSHAEGWGSFCSGVSGHAEGYFTVATGHDGHAEGAQSNAWLDSDSAHAGGANDVAGDCQYRRSVLKGTVPGNIPGEAVVLKQGILAIGTTVNNSTAYGVTVRATAHAMDLGAAARQAVYFHFEFLLTVTSGGALTVSAVSTVVGPIVQGADFAAATLVPGNGGANLLNLTFTPGSTVHARCVAVVEFAELVAN